ncbi:MAG: hypothetical protein JO333_04930 [Verrucomicrobia bacterium]|nr:hypothetical protein [Verrucomicrobiota bacterium]
MIPGYHTSRESGTTKLAFIDYALVGTAALASFWYAMVPSFWETAADANWPGLSLWVSWYPLVLVLAGAVVVGAAVRQLSKPVPGGLDQKTRIALVSGVVIVSVLMVQRVILVQELTKEREAYFDRCVSYLRVWDQRRRQVETELSSLDRELSTILERDQSTPHPQIDAILGAVRDQVDDALERVTNLAPDLNRARENAAKIESARAHDYKTSGGFKMNYRQSLVIRQPGVELLRSAEERDPLTRAEAIALAAQAVVAATKAGTS